MTDRGPVTLEAVERALEKPAEFRPPRHMRPSHPLYAKQPVFCANPATWHPTLWVVQQHHHPALSWRRELLKADPATDTSWWRLDGECGIGICHDGEHTLLNMYVRSKGIPPWEVRRTFGTYVRAKVEEAWRKRPPVTPYT